MLDGKQVTRKLVGSEDERAVSPVIGVILMVAITVILAAVIAAFVLDLGDSVEQNPQAAVSIDDADTTGVEVSVTSLDNADGVVLVDDSGEIAHDGGTLVDEADMTATGATVVVGEDSDLDWEYDGDEEQDFTVQAYFGSVDDGGVEIDDEVDSNAVVGEFTADFGT